MAFVVVAFIYVVLNLVLSSDGLSFHVTRGDNDMFKNPKTKVCDWSQRSQKFCKNANARCYQNCCQCICNYASSTFDKKLMQCRPNENVRSGCRIKFEKKYKGSRIQLLDMSKNGNDFVYWKNVKTGYSVDQFRIKSISYLNGIGKVIHSFIYTKGRTTRSGDRTKVAVKWNEVPYQYHGQLFLVNVTYTLKRILSNSSILENDCFVFKSAGKITVTVPSTSSMSTKVTTRKPSSNLSPITLTSTTARVKPTKNKTTVTHSLITKSFPNTNSSSSTIWSTYQLPTKHSTNEDKSLTHTNIWTYYTTKETGLPSASTSGESIHNAKKMTTSSGDDLIIISLASAGCIVLFLAVVIALICVRRRRTASKVNHEAAGQNVVSNNHVSTPEAIYSEAYDLPTYPGIQDASDVDNYTSLDRTKIVETKPMYESLTRNPCNMYEQIPAKTNIEIFSEEDPPEPVYNTLYESSASFVNGESTCRDGEEHAERTYSTLEEETNYKGGKDEDGGDENPERVYSVIEDDSLHYLTILPDESP